MSWRKYPYYFSSIFRLLFGLSSPVLVARTFLGLAPKGTKHIKLRRRGLLLELRSAMDMWSVKETFLDKFYERFGFPLQDGWIVIDIGAGLGEFTLDAAHGFPNSHIYAFEPYPPSFDLLQTNVRKNKLENIVAFNEAVGAQVGSLRLDLSEEEPLKLRSMDAHLEKSMDVPALSLVDVFERIEKQKCDLLKLDCEGAEYAILFNTPPETLGKIQRIVMEYHDDVTKHSSEELKSFLQDHDFKVESFPNFVHDNLGYLRASRAI